MHQVSYQNVQLVDASGQLVVDPSQLMLDQSQVNVDPSQLTVHQARHLISSQQWGSGHSHEGMTGHVHNSAPVGHASGDNLQHLSGLASRSEGELDVSIFKMHSM